MNSEDRVNQLSDMCNSYYIMLPSESKKDALELITWIAKIATSQDSIPIDRIRERFFIVRAINGSSSQLDEIANLLIEIVKSRVSTSVSTPNSPAKNTVELIYGLRNGSIPQPKVPFDQPRTVRIINRNELNSELLVRAHKDEIDTLHYLNTIVIIEPSMEPATSLMMAMIDDLNTCSEVEAQNKVEEYRQALANVIREEPILIH